MFQQYQNNSFNSGLELTVTVNSSPELIITIIIITITIIIIIRIFVCMNQVCFLSFSGKAMPLSTLAIINSARKAVETMQAKRETPVKQTAAGRSMLPGLVSIIFIKVFSS